MSKSIIRTPWIRVEGGNNMILEGKGFTVSYNPIAGADNGDPLGELAQSLGGLFNYEQAYPSLKKCLVVYNKHKADHRSGWSTD